MMFKNILILFFLLLFYFCSTTYINTRQSQQEYKQRMKYRRLHYQQCNKKNFFDKRRLDDEDAEEDDDEEDDEDDDEDPTLKVYNRCDHGHTPDDISDCTKYNTDESSCCMFTYGQDTGCVLIGFKYLGSKSVGDMTVICENYFYKISYCFLFFILMLIF